MADQPRALLEVWQDCLNAPSDAAAWDELLARTRRLLKAIASNVAHAWGLHSPEDVEDLFQDICVKISKQARSPYRKNHVCEESLLAYLKATAANAARDSLRARFAAKRGLKATCPLEERIGEIAGELGLSSLDRYVLIREIERCLEGLPSRDRAAFWLYYRQGLTAKEIAVIPAISLGPKGVESLLQRMVAIMRTELGGRAHDDS